MKIYLISCDSLANDLGVLVDPNVGGGAEHAGEHFGEHVNKISKYLEINLSRISRA